MSTSDNMPRITYPEAGMKLFEWYLVAGRLHTRVGLAIATCQSSCGPAQKEVAMLQLEILQAQILRHQSKKDSCVP